MPKRMSRFGECFIMERPWGDSRKVVLIASGIGVGMSISEVLFDYDAQLSCNAGAVSPACAAFVNGSPSRDSARDRAEGQIETLSTQRPL